MEVTQKLGKEIKIRTGKVRGRNYVREDFNMQGMVGRRIRGMTVD